MIELSAGAKVLVVGPNWLGDCVMAEPVVRQLIQEREDLQVTVMVPESLQGVFADHPQIQSVFPYQNKGRHAGWLGRTRLWADLREQGFEAAVLLRNSFGAALDASRAGIPHRIGYASFPRTWFLTQGLERPHDAKERHRTQLYLDLLAPLGIEAQRSDPQVYLAPEKKEAGLALIHSEGGDFSSPLVALHVSATYGPAKMWGVKRFAALADRFVEDHQATILFLGTREEEETISEVISFMDQAGAREDAVRNLAGKTRDIQTLGAVFAHCDLVVGNDSGPVHLAAALGVPTIAIYGSTSSDHTGIQGPKVQNIWEHFDCSPCFKRECPKEDYMACMDAVPVARAYNAGRDLLGLEEEDFEEILTAEGDTDGVKDLGL